MIIQRSLYTESWIVIKIAAVYWSIRILRYFIRRNYMSSKSNTQAMETEKIPRLLAQLVIPAVVAQIINLLYNIVDRIYIGHIPGVGAEALTGVGLFTPILMAVVLTVIFFAFAPQLLTLFGASEKTLPYGVAYARIYILGSTFVLIVMGMNPFITTQ